MMWAALDALPVTIAAGLFIAKYTPGSSVHAATNAMIATVDSRSMLPYPIARACDSRVMSLGVVPEAISEWNPLIAPQAIVTKQNGNILPENTGPDPSTNRVSAGIFSGGRTIKIPTASAAIVPSFMNVER